MKCDFCASEAVDTVTFDAGNNAEILVSVDLCEGHLEGSESDYSTFVRENGERLDALAYERHFERYAI